MPYNASMYTLDTIDYHDDEEHDRHSDTSPLLSPATPPLPSSAKIIFNATFKMFCIFIISSIFLGGTLWLALPTLEE